MGIDRLDAIIRTVEKKECSGPFGPWSWKELFMEIRFSFEEREIQKSVRKFVKNDLLPVCREVDETGVIPDRVRDKLLSMGILKSAFPSDAMAPMVSAMSMMWQAYTKRQSVPRWSWGALTSSGSLLPRGSSAEGYQGFRGAVANNFLK